MLRREHPIQLNLGDESFLPVLLVYCQHHNVIAGSGHPVFARIEQFSTFSEPLERVPLCSLYQFSRQWPTKIASGFVSDEAPGIDFRSIEMPR